MTIYICYNCIYNIPRGRNIYKAVDKTFCSENCRQNHCKPIAQYSGIHFNFYNKNMSACNTNNNSVTHIDSNDISIVINDMDVALDGLGNNNGDNGDSGYAKINNVLTPIDNTHTHKSRKHNPRKHDVKYNIKFTDCNSNLYLIYYRFVSIFKIVTYIIL